MAAGTITLTDIRHAFRDHQRTLAAVDNLSLAAQSGEFVALVGPSGCGKSTLLRIAGGLIEPESGQALIDGKGVAGARRDKSIGFVFQDPALLPWRTVRSNVELLGEVNKKPRPTDNINGLLDLVGLAEFAEYRPGQLSGGMQQRVALARALAIDPRVLLMDEPFGALDAITRDAMRHELERIWLARRPTVLFVTHGIGEALALADRIVVLSPRPARILAQFIVPFPRPRVEEIETTPEFVRLTKEIKSLLRTAP